TLLTFVGTVKGRRCAPLVCACAYSPAGAVGTTGAVRMIDLSRRCHRSRDAPPESVQTVDSDFTPQPEPASFGRCVMVFWLPDDSTSRSPSRACGRPHDSAVPMYRIAYRPAGSVARVPVCSSK